MKLAQQIDKIELSGDSVGNMTIWEKEDGSIYITRYAERGKVTNTIANYEKIDISGKSELIRLDLDKAKSILNRVSQGMPYSSSYIFYDGDFIKDIDLMKTPMEHKYTSTGIKFWRNQQAMLNYRNEDPNTIISSHISPEGACNLKCPYCSVTYRDTHSRIDLDTIKDYVDKLKTRGLKAVILTGGGEPLAYPKINELVNWLKYERNIDIGLITNGTLSHRLDDNAWKALSWVRVSVNMFDNWEQKISIPSDKVSTECIIGASMVFTVEHEAHKENNTNRIDILRRVSKLVDKFNAKYVRILPNCLLDQDHLFLMHRAIDHDLKELNDDRFFHQHKIHGAPDCGTCHQAYFRPYLSEEPFHKNGKPGTVFPCDSVVLNEGYQFFSKRYQICHASDILDFLDKKIKMEFDPRKDCKGCVFTGNVNLLENWKTNGVEKFSEYKEPLLHEQFV